MGHGVPGCGSVLGGRDSDHAGSLTHPREEHNKWLRQRERRGGEGGRDRGAVEGVRGRAAHFWTASGVHDHGMAADV